MQENEAPKTVIAEDVEIVGSIKCTSHVRLDGKLNGDLSCNGNGVIGQTANIKGNLSVDSVSVSGQVNGNITAKDRIELKSSARINGDIRAKRLTVEDGVTFVGKSEVNPAGTTPPRGMGAVDAKSPGQDASPEGGAADEEAGDKGKGAGIFSRK